MQNDVGNRYSPTIIVAAITSKIDKAKLPTHIEIEGERHGLQILTIDKRRLKEKLGGLNVPAMSRVEEGLRVSLGFAEF